MTMSQREAAKAWGMSRATIQRSVAAGKLSLTTDKTIDPAEMVRAFGEPPSRPINGAAIPDESGVIHPESHPGYTLLRAENEHLKAMLAEKDARIADLRQALQLGHDKPASGRRWWPWSKN